jgi:2'-hydroxyisoflavone reductase
MVSRREILATPALMLAAATHATASAQALSKESTEPTKAAESKAARPLRILILGGTGFTGPHQVRYALSRGHQVTLFNRGRRTREWPEKVEELTGDRNQNDYASLKGKRWDVCIDNPTSVPVWVRDAAAVLKGNIQHYIFISTVSVYAGHDKVGANEEATREKYTGMDAMAETPANLQKNMALYGPLKALSEDEAHKQFAGMTTVVRPGLIVGPGDETDRFTYWPARVARGGDMLVPPKNDPVQFIDARDLAEWTIRLAERRALGDFNAFGPDYELTMGGLLYGIRAVTGSRAAFREATLDFLQKHKVAPWSQLPVWVPGSGETAGFHRRSNARAVQAGLTFRPLATTARDTLEWWNAQPEARRAKPRAGLTAERELELLRFMRQET